MSDMYCMGMGQLMRQAGDADTAAIYERMADGMKTVLAELPKACPMRETARLLKATSCLCYRGRFRKFE